MEKQEKPAAKKNEEPKTEGKDAKEEKKEPEPEEEKQPEAVEAVELSLETVREQWPSILAQVTPPSVRMSLKNSQLVTVDEKSISISFSSSFHREKVANAEASHQIEGVMEKIFKRSVRLECTIAEGDIENGSNAESVNLAEAAAEIF